MGSDDQAMYDAIEFVIKILNARKCESCLAAVSYKLRCRTREEVTDAVDEIIRACHAKKHNDCAMTIAYHLKKYRRTK